jgi:hypothetical protein
VCCCYFFNFNLSPIRISWNKVTVNVHVWLVFLILAKKKCLFSTIKLSDKNTPNLKPNASGSMYNLASTSIHTFTKRSLNLVDSFSFFESLFSKCTHTVIHIILTDEAPTETIDERKKKTNVFVLSCESKKNTHIFGH